MKKSLVWTIIKYGLGVALLAWVLWANWAPAGDSPGLEEAFRRQFQVTPMLIAITLCLASLVLTFYRWYVLVRAQDLPFSVSDSMRLGLIGFAMSNFLPTAVGGDIIKAAFLAREQNRRTVAVATVVFDRVIGLCGLFLLVAVVGLLFWLNGALNNVALATIVTTAWLLVGLCLFFWIVLGVVPRRWIEPVAEQISRIPKIGPSLGELWRSAWIYRTRGRAVWLTLILAFIGHIGFVLSFYFAACAICPVESIPDLQTHFLIVPTGLTIQAGFPAPGGVGGGELIFGELYKQVGFAAANGVLGMLMLRLITWGLGALGYFVYLRMRPSLVGVEELPPEEAAEQQLAPLEV